MAKSFRLKIVTLDGLSYDGEAEKLSVRTVDGEVCILADHISYVTALGMGEAKIWTPEGVRSAACIGGLLSVSDNEVRLVPTTFEWAEDIDRERAERARASAEETLKDRAHRSDEELRIAEAKLRRALVRSSVSRL